MVSGMRRVLSIDGGGIKGALPASFLATIEESTGERINDHFDLIAGTSTGGIIALGLGLGFTASAIRDFYLDDGPKIFSTFGAFASLRQLRRAKYDPDPLRDALMRIFGDRLLGGSQTRLIIPAFDSTLGSVRVFKTSHHPRLEIDHRMKVIDVAMATAPQRRPTSRPIRPRPVPSWWTAACGPIIRSASLPWRVSRSWGGLPIRSGF